MKVLIITQKVNAADDVLGFFQYWLWEFWHKKEVEKPITVICLERGVHDFPEEDFRKLKRYDFRIKKARDYRMILMELEKIYNFHKSNRKKFLED